jgi:hypothetical protein
MRRPGIVLALSAFAAQGCYVSGGLGYAGGDTGTAHLSMGFMGAIGDRAEVRVGGNIAAGRGLDDELTVPGPVELGVGVAAVTRAPHALAVQTQLALPTGGNWTSSDDNAVRHAGRAFAGPAYRYTGTDKWTDPDSGTSRQRNAITGTVAVGPELFWERANGRSSNSLGVALDVTIAMRGWLFAKALDGDEDDQND